LILRLPPAPTFDFAGTATVIPVIARITGVVDKFDESERAAENIFSSPFATPLISRLAEAGRALTAVMREDAAQSKRSYDALEASRGIMFGPALIVGTGDRLLGLLSQTSGNFGQAVGHFEDSLTFCRKAGCRPELAWTCHDYADTLVRRNSSGDRAKALSLLDEALAISQELGMEPLIERVVAIKEKAESQPGAAPAYPDGLTAREVEVLQLIAAGKTDREIAEELFVSVRTVGYHVGNILNKTTSSNRAEAAVYAARQGLV